MRVSLCTKILVFVTTIVGVMGQHTPVPGYHSESDINNAWIKVRWTEGGHYFHNTLTREDRDILPEHLHECTEDLIKETCNI